MHKALAIPQPWGRRSRSWMVLCLCALKFMDPFSFAVPKKAAWVSNGDTARCWSPNQRTSISAPAGIECNVFVCILSFCGCIVAFAFKPSKHSQREQLQSSLPQFEVYVNAMKLYGKLNQESPVRELRAELQRPLRSLAPMAQPSELAKAVAHSHETNVLLQTHSVPTRLDLVHRRCSRQWRCW